MTESARRSSWTFITNHAHVLLCIAREPGVRLRDVATTVGITERATQSIVADLAADGYVSRTRVGRRNTYVIHDDAPLRLDGVALTVGGLLDYLQSPPRRAAYQPIGRLPVTAGPGRYSEREEVVERTA